MIYFQMRLKSVKDDKGAPYYKIHAAILNAQD